eukprot:1166253-Pyramimonas_sp.AAC.1
MGWVCVWGGVHPCCYWHRGAGIPGGRGSPQGTGAPDLLLLSRRLLRGDLRPFERLIHHLYTDVW